MPGAATTLAPKIPLARYGKRAAAHSRAAASPAIPLPACGVVIADSLPSPADPPQLDAELSRAAARRRAAPGRTVAPRPAAPRRLADTGQGPAQPRPPHPVR